MDIYSYYLVLDELVTEYERHCDRLVQMIGYGDGVVEGLHEQAELQTQHLRNAREVTLKKIKGIHHS